ncbi:MAG: Gfo/Idh/MocA family oxidoreductase, partial [Pseudomonadota bacterium]
MTAKPKLGIGLIGSGFMGMTHAFGFATAERVFDLPFELSYECLADATDEMAERARARFGFARATGDWRRLLADPAIDIIDITAPNAFHKEMSLAAIAAGKHVYCEKPLAPLASDALEMMRAADAAGVKT